MVSALEYMAQKHKTLTHDYRTPDGKYSESCSFIAFEVAEKLLLEGRKPTIVSFSKDRRVGNFVTNEPLQPKPYGSEVIWFAHVVCVCDGEVYDPVMGHPIQLDDYSMQIFGKEIPWEVGFNQQDTSDAVFKVGKWEPSSD